MENQIYESLKQVVIPLNYKRPNMSGFKYKGADNRNYGYGIRSVTLGIVRDWKTGGKIISNFTKHNLQLWELLLVYGESICNYPFSSICINYNTIAQPHKDINNSGESTIVGIGNYKYGELVVVYPDGEKIIDIHNKPYTFDGSVYLHYSLPFENDRYSLIFFK